jgi:hypothetical protein
MTLRTADGGRQPSGEAVTKSSLCRSIASQKPSVPLRWTHLAPMYKVTFHVTATELEVFPRSANVVKFCRHMLFFFPSVVSELSKASLLWRLADKRFRENAGELVWCVCNSANISRGR